MNQTIKTILSRRSIRCYQSKAVERELIDQILECGKFAPSAMGMQPWHFTVVTKREILDEIDAAKNAALAASGDKPRTTFSKNNDTFRGAPMAIFVSGDKKAKYGEPDSECAVENMALAAHSLGLGSCIIASFRHAFKSKNRERLLKLLQIPDGFEPYFALSIGYADEEPSQRAARREGIVTFI